MIEIDDSQLSETFREFLRRWAEALDVPVAVLVFRIVEGEIDGDHFVEKRPRD